MTSFDTLQSISSRLNELTNQLSTSNLSKEELEEFETLSRKIYERAVILSYKAKEESVYGKPSDKALDSTFPFSDEQDEVEDNETKQPVAENYMEAIVEEHEIIEDEQEELILEKEVTEDEGRVQFDFSGGFDTAKAEEKPVVKEEPIIEEVESNADEKSADLISNLEKEEPLPHTDHTDKTALQEQESSSLNELLKEDDNKSAVFYKQFLKAYNAAAGDRLGTSKISSLKGAIGLNDRLQFISELFRGDASLYNEIIDQLDQQENSKAALAKLSEVAAKENWNKEDSSVEEFAHFITRRYVD
jgi:hypothetical protein